MRSQDSILPSKAPSPLCVSLGLMAALFSTALACSSPPKESPVKNPDPVAVESAPAKPAGAPVSEPSSPPASLAASLPAAGAVTISLKKSVIKSKRGYCVLTAEYPEISGLSNAAVEAKLNKLLEEKFLTRD